MDNRLTIPQTTFSAHVRVAMLCLIGLMGLSTDITHAAANAKASKYYEEALTFFDRKEIPSAIIQLKNAVQIDPGMLSAQLLLGKALLVNGEVVAAEVALYARQLCSAASTASFICAT